MAAVSTITYQTINFSINIHPKSADHGYLMDLTAKTPIPKDGCSDFKMADDYPFHVGLIRIPNVSSEHAAKFKKYIGSFIQAQLEKEPLLFTPYNIDRYTAGDNRNHNKSPIVLYPSKTDKMKFKAFNLMLHGKIAMFNANHATEYEPGFETEPTKYTPHITIFQQPMQRAIIGQKAYSINQQLQQFKDNTIKAMNSYLQTHKPKPFQLPVPKYQY